MKLLYLHDDKQNLNSARLDELKKQFGVVAPFISDSDLKDEIYIRSILANFGNDAFLLADERLAEQQFLPLLKIQKPIRKEVILNFEQQPLEIPCYLTGLLLNEGLNTKPEMRYFYVMRCQKKLGSYATNERIGNTLALNREMIISLHKAVDRFLKKYNPKTEDWLALEVAFYHKVTSKLLSVYEFCGSQITRRDIDRHLFSNLNFCYSLKLKSSSPFSEWRQALDERYYLDWDEVLNTGEMKLKFKTKPK